MFHYEEVRVMTLNWYAPTPHVRGEWLLAVDALDPRVRRVHSDVAVPAALVFYPIPLPLHHYESYGFS